MALVLGHHPLVRPHQPADLAGAAGDRWATALLGFVDDYIKIVKKNKKGVPGKVKLLVQFAIGAAAIAWLFWGGGWAPELRDAAVGAAAGLRPGAARAAAWRSTSRSA